LIALTKLFENLRQAYKKQLPFVAYKKANTDLVTALFQYDNRIHYVKDYTEEGFVFAPFDNKTPAILIPNKNLAVSSIADPNLKTRMPAAIYQEKLGVKEQHISLIADTKKFIEKSEVSKIVVARTKDIKIDKGFDVFQTFENLLVKYKHATCYVWYHPKVGLWMGATPETLVEIKGTVFSTMSLAGTQKYHGTTDVSWGAKEIEEQQLVTDYVLSNLKSVCTSLKSSKTFTAKAGALLHLRTDISGNVSTDKGVASLIHVLHPTPAVCGFPREASKEFILKNEKFDRTFYTGYLGELNMDNTSSLYVNLRCLQVIDRATVRLYIGGGITTKSKPELEWEETMAKCKTMESIL